MEYGPHEKTLLIQKVTTLDTQDLTWEYTFCFISYRKIPLWMGHIRSADVYKFFSIDAWIYILSIPATLKYVSE